MNPDDYKYYLDLRPSAALAHSGFGAGFRRLVMYLTSVDNIRDLFPRPRTIGSVAGAGGVAEPGALI